MSALSDSVKESIDNVLNSKYFDRPTALAEAYLSNEKIPLPLKSNLEKHMKEIFKWAASSVLVEPQALKRHEDDFRKYWKGIFEQMRGRIGALALKKLEQNYDAVTIDRILRALVDFELFLKRPDILTLEKTKKRRDDSKKQCQNVIKAMDFALMKAFLSDSEKEMIQKIKVKHKAMLDWDKVVCGKKVVLDPVAELLLNLKAETTILGGREGWTEEFYKQCQYKDFVKPHGRPKKLFPKALAVVIFKLLEKGSKQINWRYRLTADIINSCFDEGLTHKGVENALFSS